MSYQDELKKSNFIGNIVIKMRGVYFGMREPDSGLSIDEQYRGLVDALTIPQTSVDLKNVNTTISTYSFRLLDQNQVITKLLQGDDKLFVGEQVEIWIGRTSVDMDFSDYWKLPVLRVKKVDYVDSIYNFAAADQTDRMNKPVFNLANKLDVSILAGTTTITMKNDTAGFPSSGMMKIDDEFISWTGKNDASRQLTGCVRGEKSSTPAEHDEGADAYNVVDVTGNPLDVLMQIMVSGGGGGSYDVLSDGLAIDQNLIDIAGIEAIRDAIFAGEQFSFTLFNVANALKFIETEILLACNLRFTVANVSNVSKISVALLDQSVFGSSIETIDSESIIGSPKWSPDENRVINRIEIEWDYDYVTKKYRQITLFEDADSIANYPNRKPLKYQFKGIKAALGGQDIVDDRGNRLLERFATPTPQISLKTFISKSLLTSGSKAVVISDKIPSNNGTLNFSADLEVLSIAINPMTGDVIQKLVFTSYSGIRKCYIAPSDKIMSVVDQRTFTVPAGRGASYSVGWKMRLWEHLGSGVGGDYAPDALNEIESISGDEITMKDPWTTSLVAGQHRIKFADYDDVTADQKRYGFISAGVNDFSDGSSYYSILF